MRDDQSDKAEQTGETDDTSGKDACEGQKQKAGVWNAQSEGARDVIPKPEHI